MAGRGIRWNRSAADMEPLARGRRVIYYDQRGQGRSELITDGKKLGYEQHVADLEAVRVHFKLEKMSLIGNSWGGLLVSLYAVAHPDRVERMVLDSPAAPIARVFSTTWRTRSRGGWRRSTSPNSSNAPAAIRDPDAWLKAKDPVAICREFYLTVLSGLHVFADTGRQFQGRRLCRRPRVSSACSRRRECPRLAQPRRL